MRKLVLACVMLVLAACGGVEPRPVAPTEAHPARSEARPAIVPPACRIDAVRAEALSVTPEGREPFTVSISDGALALIVGDHERALDVEVEQPLRFSAHARVDDQRLVSRVEGELVAGAVTIVPELPVIEARQRERGLGAYLQLGRRSPATSLGVELVVGPLSIPCESIVAIGDPEPEATSALPRRVPGGELRVASVVPLVVRALRVAPAQVEVRPRERDGFVPMWMIDREGEAARVVIAFADGARIEGWVALSSLREPSVAEAELVERMVRDEGTARMTYGILGALEPAQLGPQADEYVGPASLRAASRVYAAPGEAPWASSAEHPLEVRVRWQRGRRHVQLLDVPGMWIPPEHAWVERTDVAIPEP